MANPILEHLRLSGTTYDLVDASAIHDLSDYSTTEQVNSAITAATSALAESIAEQGYQTSGDVQNAIAGKADTTAVTEAIDAAVSGKADTTAVTQAISEAVSGKLDTSVFNTYSGDVATQLASKIAGAAWDSTTSHLNFFDNVSATGTPLTYVDGADWVKDSFLKSVSIENREVSGETVPCLVFVFDTETGEEETLIPLSDIFDPNNYYTTGQTDAAIAAATSGKVDTNTYTAYTAATDSILSGKQNTLTAGTGIDITNDVISVTGKADTSAVTAIQDSLSGYVTTDTEQTISGRKIFTYSANSGKAIEFKQTSNSAKVGFSIKNSAETNNELASFEFRPNTFTIDAVQHPLLYFGHYRSTAIANAGVPQTVIGFRQYDQLNAAAYHYLMPLPEKAKTPFSLTTSFKDYYAPMGFKNGSTMITADDTGVVDLSSELGGLKLVKLSQSEYDALSPNYDSNTLYVIVN
jgi:hypothetical protein